MTVLDTFIFEKVAIKTEGAMPRTKSNKGLFSTQRQVTLMVENGLGKITWEGGAKKPFC